MNEQVKELMEKAGLYDFMVEAMGIEEEVNNFAELLISACADIGTINQFQAAPVGNYIKEHFGVKK